MAARSGAEPSTSMITHPFRLSLLAAFALAAAALLSTGPSLASAQTPAPTGQVAVQVTLQAGPQASARTWRFEVLNATGAVVQTLSLGTSGPALTSTEATGPLPFGPYTVRQILGNDTLTACSAASFYEVTAPAGARAAVELGSARVTVAFTIRTCPALPANPRVQAPIDTVAPVAGGVSGSPSASPTPPIDEVRGTRDAGPAAPLPPNTGDGAWQPVGEPGASLLLVLFGLVATFIPSAGYAYAHARQRSKR